MKQFKTISPPMNVVFIAAHIDLTLTQWDNCRDEDEYTTIIAAEVRAQLGWNGNFTASSKFHYLEHNRGVRVTINYEYLEPV